MLWISFLIVISVAYLTTYAEDGYVVDSLFISPFTTGTTAIIQDIVNIEKIEAIEDLSIAINKKLIPIGASYKENFLKKLNIL